MLHEEYTRACDMVNGHEHVLCAISGNMLDLVLAVWVANKYDTDTTRLTQLQQRVLAHMYMVSDLGHHSI